MFWKDDHSKNMALEYYLSCCIIKKYDKGKMIFLKKYTEIRRFLQMLQKHCLYKKNHVGIWLSYISRKMVFFPEKYIFSFDEKLKMIFLNKYMEIWYILCIYRNVKNMILPFCKRKKIIKDVLLPKNTLKGDWHSRSHSRKSSNDSLYFYGYLYRRFHILLSSEKKSGNLIYRIEIWFFL